MSPSTPQAGRGPRLRLLAGTSLVLSLATLGLASPTGAAPALLPRETCVPIPDLPCLPDLPVPAAPTAETPAAITGTPKVDKVLTAVEPTWDNPVTITTYQWQRDGVAIAEATNDTYTVQPDDIDAQVTVAATGTVAVIFSTVSTSEPVVGVIGDAPVLATPPTVAGTLHVGETLTANPGTWEGSPEPTFTYQWYRSQGGTRVIKISGADEQTYTLTTTDAGHRLAMVVVATRPGHTAAASAAITSAVDKLETSAALTTTKSTIKKTRRALVTVALTSADGGVPSGKVVIRDGKRRVGIGAASATNGRATVRLERLKPGTHRLVATYAGSESYAKAKSARLSITVKRR